MRKTIKKPIKQVPKDLSILEEVKSFWAPIVENSHKTLVHESLWKATSKLIELREHNLQTNMLDPSLDWHPDLIAAKYYHTTMIAWAEKSLLQQSKRDSHWFSISEALAKITHELGLAGIRMAFIGHGAVAIGSLGLIAQIQEKNYLYYCATTAILFSAFGIFLLASGASKMLMASATLNQHIRHKLQYGTTPRDSVALYRYWQKYFRQRLIISDVLIYGSVFWFVFYVAVFAIVLFIR